MSIDELAQEIGGSREDLNRAIAGVTGPKARAEELSTRLAGMGAESMSQYMSEVAGQLDTARQTLTGVTDGLAQTQATAAGAKEHCGGLLGGGGSSPTPARPAFKPMRTDPAKVAEIQPYVGEPVAYATLWDAQVPDEVRNHAPATRSRAGAQ